MIQILVILLAASGLVISASFAAVAAGLITPGDPRVPRFCRLEEQACHQLLRSADAKVFGVPNILIALGYYAGLLVVAADGDAFDDLVGFLLLPGLLTVVLGVYLLFRLTIVHRQRCGLCVGAHVINMVLFILFLAGL